MILELDDERRILFDLIDEPVFFVYSSGPIAGEGMPKRLWFAFSLIRCSTNIFDNIIYSFENPLIFSLPKEVVLHVFK
jgi:hypothetical protein